MGNDTADIHWIKKEKQVFGWNELISQLIQHVTDLMTRQNNHADTYQQ